jgi:Bacterial Ig domain
MWSQRPISQSLGGGSDDCLWVFDMTEPASACRAHSGRDRLFAAPAAGATVFSLVTVSAAASDNVGIAGVRFFVDGQPLGDEVTAAPYSITWDTTTTPLGGHVLAAEARDFAGKTTMSVPVPVIVAATTPALVGQWAGPFAWPIVAVHATLLPTAASDR